MGGLLAHGVVDVRGAGHRLDRAAVLLSDVGLHRILQGFIGVGVVAATDCQSEHHDDAEAPPKPSSTHQDRPATIDLLSGAS